MFDSSVLHVFQALKDYAIVLLLGGWKEADVKVLVNRGLLYLELHDYANSLEVPSHKNPDCGMLMYFCVNGDVWKILSKSVNG